MHDKAKSSSPSRLIEVNLDESSIGSHTPEVDHERRVAIFDLLEENTFELVGGPGGTLQACHRDRREPARFRRDGGRRSGARRHVPSVAHSFSQAGQGLLPDLRELFRGDQIRAAEPDRGARHGAARDCTTKAASFCSSGWTARRSWTTQRRGGFSRCFARSIGRGRKGRLSVEKVAQRVQHGVAVLQAALPDVSDLQPAPPTQGARGRRVRRCARSSASNTATFDAGMRSPRLHVCPCQKQPWTKMAFFRPQNTMSGLPGRLSPFSR